ncbi:efflux RND transporter periplasmic adaptor subunit [Streptacidiphilus sp. N1-3]|uniref:Efflux RND transporter periplasmic adaptor subunit n=1 Tax=Streptacidiphilus alkalitolerans TaxID=3342712 RepID=A0ABV6X5V3_9ACTN
MRKLRGLGNFRVLAAVEVLAFGSAAVLLMARHAPAPREFTVRPVDLRSTVALTGYLEPAVTWRLYFGASTASTAASTASSSADTADTAGGAGSACGGAASAAQAGVGLGAVSALKVAPGDKVSKGQELAEADTAAARAALASVQQDLDQANSLLAQDRERPGAASTASAPDSPASGASPQLLVGQDLDRVQRDQDRIAALQRTVDAARITAPADGIVQEVDTALGASPDCRSAAIVLRSTGLRAHVQAPGGVLARLQTGQAVQLALPGTSLRVASTVAVLPQAASAPDPAPTTPVLVPAVAESAGPPQVGAQDYSLDLALPVPPPGTLPGMAVTATVTLDERAGVLAVPMAAVHHDRTGIHVAVLHCASAKRSCRSTQVTVTTGLSADRMTQITAGLHNGDTIAVPSAG